MLSRTAFSVKPIAAGKTAQPSRCVVVRAGKRSEFEIAPVFAAGIVAASLLLGAPSAQAYNFGEDGAAREAAIEAQKRQLEYILEQQSIAKQAALAAQRQQLAVKVNVVESALQQKITEERAGVVAAQASGDSRRAGLILAEQEQLEAKKLQVQQAAAKIEAQIDRADMLEKARTAAAKQAVAKAASEAEYDINKALDSFLEKVAAMDSVKTPKPTATPVSSTPAEAGPQVVSEVAAAN